MAQYLKEIISRVNLDKTWKEKFDQREEKKHTSAKGVKQILVVLSAPSLLFIFSVLWPVSMTIKTPYFLLFGYSALVFFTLYKERDLRSSIASHNKGMAELVNWSFRLANERGTKLFVEPRIRKYTGDEGLDWDSSCSLELVAFLHEGEIQRRFFTAYLPLYYLQDDPFDVENPRQSKIDVFFDEETLNHLGKTPPSA